MRETVSERPGLLGGAVFRDEGIVAPAHRLSIVETLTDPQSVVGEEFRLLRSRVQTACQERKIGCLGVVSALPGEGKSTIALGLAIALAREAGRRILLVETDLRRPTISRNLGVPPFPGLGEWLNGDIDHVPVRRVEPGGFFLLGAGEVALDQPEALGSARMEALLRAAREPFDLVVLDATPILPVADVVLMQDLVDGFLLVVRSRMTPRDAVHDALGRIRSDKVIGVVLNDHREYKGSYMSHAYKGYGIGEGKKSRYSR
jgi:capsular exopolysaccharide synthesis family protein